MCALTAGPGRDQRDERDRLGGPEPLAAAGAGRARAPVPLGPGVAAGARPPAVRAPADQARRHRAGDRPRSRGWSTRRSAPRWRPRSGPAFLDFPLDVVFSEAERARAPSRRPRPRRPAADARAIERAAALLRGRRAPGDHGRHGAVLGPRGGRAACARRAVADPRVPERARPRVRRRRPRAVLLARARHGAGRRRRGAGDRGAARLPARLRGGVRARGRDRRDRRRRARARPSAAGRRRAVRVAHRRRSRRCAPPPALRATRSAPSASAGSSRCGPTRTSGARRRSPSARTRARRFTRCACTPSSREVLDRDAIVVGDGGDFVSYAGRVVDSYLPGCWLDPGPFGCLGSGPGYAIAAKLARPDKQVVLLLGDGAFGFAGDGVRHDGPARDPGRRRDGQQRDLGPREAPDGVPLRVLGRGRPAARRRATTRSCGRSAATASWCPGPRSCGPRSSARCSRQARVGQRAHRSVGGVPAALEPGLAVLPAGWRNENRPLTQRAASDPGLAQSGRAGVRARKGRLDWLGRREAPMSAASPEPMSETSETGSTANHSPNQTAGTIEHSSSSSVT